jgi:hypothetical protein
VIFLSSSGAVTRTLAISGSAIPGSVVPLRRLRTH